MRRIASFRAKASAVNTEALSVMRTAYVSTGETIADADLAPVLEPSVKTKHASGNLNISRRKIEFIALVGVEALLMLRRFMLTGGSWRSHGGGWLYCGGLSIKGGGAGGSGGGEKGLGSTNKLFSGISAF